MITASAPGKLMLMGGHAVVYGHPCLVTAVDRRLNIAIEETGDGKVTIEAPQVKDTSFVQKAVEVACKQWKTHHNGLRIQTECSFSGKYGLGSSAAVVVATVKALSVLFKKNLDPRATFDLSYKIILDVQGVGSGFDVASATFGGTLYFVKGGKVLESLNGEARNLPIVVGYTGIKSSSVELIRHVREMKDAYPAKVNRIFSAIGSLVDQGKQALTQGDWKKLGKLMDFNQEYLRDLGVSSDKLEDLISAAKKAGAWGVKLSGAGGGDCMIALVPEVNREKVCEAIRKAGGEIVDVRPHEEGVRVESSDNPKEMFIVVDTSDTIIGYKTRAECHRDPSLVHRSAGVVIFDDRGRALLQKRSATKDLQPGLWGISAAGHVTKGETYEQCIERELKEELGISIPMKLAGKFLLSDATETEMSTIFTAHSNGPFRADPSEVDELLYIGKTELPKKLESREIVLTTWATQALKHIGFLV